MRGDKLSSTLHTSPLKTLLSLCAVATTAQLFTACDEGAVTVVEPPPITPGNPNMLPMPAEVMPEEPVGGSEATEKESDEMNVAGSEESVMSELGAVGDTCYSSSECATDICYFDRDRDGGVCVEFCDAAGTRCDERSLCEDVTGFGLICVPEDAPKTGGPGDVEDPSCTVAPNRQFIYLVDNKLNIRSYDPATGNVQERGGCDRRDIVTMIRDGLIERSDYSDYQIERFEQTFERTFERTFSVGSLAVSSTGRGFIAFTMVSDSDAAYGIITIPNVNSVIECTATVNFLDEHTPALTLSVARDPNDGYAEKLYGNLFYPTDMNPPSYGRDSDESINVSPSRVFEVNMDDTADIYPVLSLQDLRLTEVTQDSHGQMFSLFVEDGCHGECYEPEPGLPRPEGVQVKVPHLVEVDLTTESLGKVYPIVIPDPYKLKCNSNYRDTPDPDCTYNTGHNIAFLNGEAYLVYTASNGTSKDNLSLNTYQDSGRSYLRKLRLDPSTETYVYVNDNPDDNPDDSAYEIPGIITGAASVSCR